MSGEPDPSAPAEQRERLLDGWDRVSGGWGRQAERMRTATLPVSDWMLDRAQLAPGVRVVELAAGPGDLALLAAPRVAPTKVLCTDAVESMVDVARERATEDGVENIEFGQLQLEWIDLPAASVDVVMCRYGVMLCVDPEAALRECRRVLAPGGRLVLAVQDTGAHNPWVTLPAAAATALGLLDSDPDTGPGPFALAAPGMLEDLLASAGFVEFRVETVAFEWTFRDELDWIGEKLDHSSTFSAMWRTQPDRRRAALREEIRARAADAGYAAEDGTTLSVPGRAHVAVAHA